MATLIRNGPTKNYFNENSEKLSSNDFLDLYQVQLICFTLTQKSRNSLLIIQYINLQDHLRIILYNFSHPDKHCPGFKTGSYRGFRTTVQFSSKACSLPTIIYMYCPWVMDHDRPLWLKWPTTVAQKTVHYRQRSIFHDHFQSILTQITDHFGSSLYLTPQRLWKILVWKM